MPRLVTTASQKLATECGQATSTCKSPAGQTRSASHSESQRDIEAEPTSFVAGFLVALFAAAGRFTFAKEANVKRGAKSEGRCC